MTGPDSGTGAGVGVGFKRNLVLPGVVTTAFELALVVWPLFGLFGWSDDQRLVLLRATAPIAVGAILLWFGAMASWLAPVQRALALRRRGESLDAETTHTAYRALGLVPLRSLWLRVALWTGAAVAYGLLLVEYSDWHLPQVASLVSLVALNSFVVSIFRAAWYTRLFGQLRRQLVPAVEPLQLFADRYFGRLLLVGLLVASGAAAALSAFIYYFLPIRTDAYLQVQRSLPGALAIMTALWVLYARRARGVVDVYLEAQLAQPELARWETTPDPRAIAAYRAAQMLPYRLVGGRVVAMIAAAAAVAGLSRYAHGMEGDNAVLMFGAAVVIAVGSGIYEAVWHRDTMRPLLAHVATRHRLPVRDVRAPLSLRTKLLVSFGGLVLFACGLSLFWGFVQYKKLATSYMGAQAQLKLDWLMAEIQSALKQPGADVPRQIVRKTLDEASIGAASTGAVFYFVPARGVDSGVQSAGGGKDGVPALPWYAAARLRAGTRGAIEIDSLSLAGNYRRILVGPPLSQKNLGTVAVLYPGYRGRGPGIERPLKELLVFFLVLFGASGGIVVLTVGEFTQPIRELEQRADEMARGELSRPVTSASEGDEIGRLTFAMEEMRRVREKLRSTTELNVDLEREVQRRTADLARKNRELAEALEKLRRAQSQLVQSEKMASIGQLVAGIAHEINNPVNAIVNTVGPLAESIEELSGPGGPKGSDGDAAGIAADIREMVTVVQRGAKRTKDIVQALHNYSRTDDERIVEFDLNRGLEDSLELLRHHLKGNIEVARKYGEVGRIKGHAGQLNQVFMNLLTNAAQALAGREGARIDVVTRRVDDSAVIQIADNGPGIPVELQTRIFDPFFTTKEVGQGSGLGLSIVHGIVERHGGSIRVESGAGEGTSFTVTLPVGGFVPAPTVVAS